MNPPAPGFVDFFAGSGLATQGAKHACVPVASSKAGTDLRAVRERGMRMRLRMHGLLRRIIHALSAIHAPDAPERRPCQLRVGTFSDNTPI